MVPGGSLSGLHAGNAFTNDFNFFGVGWAHLITSDAGIYAAQWDTSLGTYASSTVVFKASTSSVTSHSVSLNWVASTSSNVIGYKVYRANSSGGVYALLAANVTATSFNDTNVQSGLTYFYVVTAVDTNGLESGYSNQTQASIP